MFKKLTRRYYSKDTLWLARNLLGKVLVANIAEDKVVSGIIVETEAYIGSKRDPACHCSKGITERNKVMFDMPGISYVYFTYGMHYCFNVVTEKKGRGAAVLIRALEPLEGVDLMKKRRKTSNIKNIANGPAKLCQALGIDKRVLGEDLTKSNTIWIEDRGIKVKKSEIVQTTRIGISKAQDLPWRFYIKNNSFISKK